MTTEEWTHLKRDYRATGLTMACGQAGVPKTSRLGSQFFAHKAGADCQLHEGGPESAVHLATKAAVARAAREIGWEAIIESPSPDRTWIADVLVSNGQRTIAVEAQWSPQSLVDFERRQRRYESAGIECIWLAAKVNSLNAHAVPHHMIEGDVDSLKLWLPGLPDTVGASSTRRSRSSCTARSDPSLSSWPQVPPSRPRYRSAGSAIDG